MSVTSKIMGLIAGVSAVGVIGVAVAQGVEPNDLIPSLAIGAGQQSTYHTGMGETGLPPVHETWVRRTAVIVPAPVVAVVPAPEVIAVVPQPAPIVTVMGAGPAPAPEVMPAPAPVVRMRKHDRN